MASITAGELNRSFGRVQEEVTNGPLVVTHHGKPRLMLLSMDSYRQLERAAESAAQQENALQRFKLQTVLDNISEAYISLDRKWHYRTINRAAELYLGQPRDELIGRVWNDPFPAIGASEAERQLRRAMEHGELVQFEWASVVHPGRRIEIRAFPLPLPEGGIGIVFSNRVEREELERRLRLAEGYVETLEKVVEPLATLVYDEDAIIRRWSEGAEALLGWRAAEVIGSPAERIFSPDAVKAGAPWNEIGVARREGRAECITDHVAKDGTPRRLRDVVVPFPDGKSFLKLLMPPPD